MKFIFVIVLFVISSCSELPLEKKVDLNQLIEENNFRTITVDSLFQISFPERLTKTALLSEDAILQFNDLSCEEHFIVLNSAADSITVSLEDKLNEIVRANEISNVQKSSFENEGVSIENYICDVSIKSSLEEYTYWITRFKWSTKRYIICRWTLKNNKGHFIKDANLIEKTFQIVR